MKKIYLITIISILSIGCNKNNKIEKIESELHQLNQYLTNEVEVQHNYYKKISGCNIIRDDSIYFAGNQLVDQIEKGIDLAPKDIDYFYNESSSIIENKYVVKYNKDNLNDFKELEIAKIKIIQSQYYRSVIFANMDSHFQLNIIGISPQKVGCKFGTLNKINLSLWYYNNMIINPIVIIGKDTLEGDGFDYKYSYKPQKIGYDTIHAKIITERWGKTLELSPFFVLKVNK